MLKWIPVGADNYTTHVSNNEITRNINWVLGKVPGKKLHRWWQVYFSARLITALPTKAEVKIIFVYPCHFPNFLPEKVVLDVGAAIPQPRLLRLCLCTYIYIYIYIHCESKKTVPFLSRVSILLLTRDIDIVILSVCLSICLSVCLFVRDTLVLYENGLTYRHSFSTIR